MSPAGENIEGDVGLSSKMMAGLFVMVILLGCWRMNDKLLLLAATDALLIC